jgi:hypothetical protein
MRKVGPPVMVARTGEMPTAAIPTALRTTPVVARLIPLTDVVTAEDRSQR